MRYSSLGADRLLLLLYRDRPEELQAFVGETLGPLLKHDEGAPTPLLPTLRAFLAHGGRLRETAERRCLLSHALGCIFAREVLARFERVHAASSARSLRNSPMRAT